MEISKKEDESEVKENIEMPDVTGTSIGEAKKILKEINLEVEFIGDGDNVIDQLPKKGIQINSGTKVTLYCN